MHASVGCRNHYEEETNVYQVHYSLNVGGPWYLLEHTVFTLQEAWDCAAFWRDYSKDGYAVRISPIVATK